MSKKKIAFPTLYKKTSTGAIQEWTTWVVGADIHTKWGQKDGALQTISETIKSGKNIGKSNETTPAEQAEFEAKARWLLKIKKGYVEEETDAGKGKVNTDVITGGIFPMLAHVYEDNKKHVKFPAYVQPKLDGHRCIATVKNGKCTLWSRTRKPILSMPHIIEQLEKVCSSNDIEDIAFDGELYNHNNPDKFEELTSYIRDSKPLASDLQHMVSYYVYDIADNADAYSERVKELNSIFKATLPSSIEVVSTFKVENEEEMYDQFYAFTKNKYEGAMYRSADGKYVNKRSRDLMKIKEFKDAEFTVARVEEGRGKMEGHAVFICLAHNGSEFKVKMAAPQEKLKEIYNNSEKYINKQLTVKYQGLTADSIPRFPVGMRFREDV